MLNTINSLDQTMSSFEIAQITAVKIHAEISVQGKEITITLVDKVSSSIDKIDEELLESVNHCRGEFLNQLTEKAGRLGYQVTLRRAPLFQTCNNSFCSFFSSNL